MASPPRNSRPGGGRAQQSARQQKTDGEIGQPPVECSDELTASAEALARVADVQLHGVIRVKGNPINR